MSLQQWAKETGNQVKLTKQGAIVNSDDKRLWHLSDYKITAASHGLIMLQAK